MKQVRRFLAAWADRRDWVWLAGQLNPGQRTRIWDAEGVLIADSDRGNDIAAAMALADRVELYPPSVVRLATARECRRARRAARARA